MQFQIFEKKLLSIIKVFHSFITESWEDSDVHPCNKIPCFPIRQTSASWKCLGFFIPFWDRNTMWLGQRQRVGGENLEHPNVWALAILNYFTQWESFRDKHGGNKWAPVLFSQVPWWICYRVLCLLFSRSFSLYLK